MTNSANKIDTDSAATKATYRVRLRVRFSKGLTTEDFTRTVEFEKRLIAITSQDLNQALSKTTWFVLSAGGFECEAEAFEFGQRLRQALILAALSSRLGVDAGSDTPTLWINEDFVRSRGLIKPHERLAPNVHGIMVIPDDGNTRIPLMNAEATVTAAPEQLLGAIASIDHAPTLSPTVREAIIVLNMALINTQPMAQLALALSAVEAIGQNEEWTPAQSSLIERLAIQAEASSASTLEESAEVAGALRRGLHKVGLRQGVIRVLSRLDLIRSKGEWDRIYGLRSGLFHGTFRPNEQEVAQLANDAITLCATIVLTLAMHEGFAIPKIAATHFPMLEPKIQ